MAVINGTEGNDQGVASLNGTPGNDTINGFGGDDSVNALAGDDVVNLRAAGGFGDTVHGGDGNDSLAVQFDVAGAINFDASGPGGHIRFITASASLAHALQAMTGTSFKLGIGNFAYAGVNFDGIENLSLVAFNAAQDDLLVNIGQGSYDGGAGSDTFFADWSALAGPTIWDNQAGASQGVNGSSIANAERLLLRTGGGNDDLRNTAVATSDEFETGAGNDTVHSGGGADRIDLGAGNDVARVVSAAGFGDTVVGGAGTDTLFVDASTSGETGIFWSGANASSQSVGGTVNRDSSMSAVSFLLSSAFWLDMNTGNGIPGVVFNTVENLSLLASQSAAYDDLLIVVGNGTYDAAGGTDALFADWSAANADVVWHNAAGAAQPVNGSTFANVERLLVKTGSGADDLRNTVAVTNDEFETGAGNDTIDAGAGIDRVDAGAGDDDIRLYVNTASNAKDTVLGGPGIDSLQADASSGTGRLDWEAYGSGGNYLGMALYNASLASIAGVVDNASRLVVSGLSFEGIERLSLFASSTGNLDDLLIVLGSGTYSGGNGSDTLYANWSAATAGIAWNNLASTTVQTVNGSAFSGVERLLLKTGSGHDDLRNAAVGTYDEFETGAGNDTIDAGAGNDRVVPGAGNDSVDAGTGSDTVVFSGNRSLYTATRNADASAFIVISVSEGIDWITGAETFQFADGAIAASAFGNVDAAGPVVATLHPADGASAVNASADIVVAFDEPIQRGSGTVLLKDDAGNTVATFAADSPRLTLAGTKLTIDPEVELSALTRYSVELSASAVRDRFGNGNLAVTGWDFTTGGGSWTGTHGPDTMEGDAYANRFTGLGGNDTIDGLGGIDTAVYTGPRDDYSVTAAPGLRFVSDLFPGGEGSDRLTSVERLRFLDGSIAYDLDGNAGSAARLVGALFGAPALHDALLVGGLVGLMDSGIGYLGAAAVGVSSTRFAELAGSHSHTDFVRTVYQNVYGAAPSPADLAGYVALLDSGAFTQASMATLVADTDANKARIGLDALAANGLRYDPRGADSWLAGATGGDALAGSDGNEQLYGLAGNDVLYGGPGSDTLDGGEGFDVASWGLAAGAIAIDANLATGQAAQGGDIDVLAGIEAIFATRAADTLRGADGVATQRGETIRGGAGNDTIDGGSGVDAAEYLGARAGYTVTRNGNAISVVDTNSADGNDGSDSLLNVERLVFADSMLAFGTRAEELARVAFVLWTPGIVVSQALFSRGYSYYDNGGYDFATMCSAALTFHNEQGLAFAQKLKANMPGTAKSVDQIFAIMNAAGGGEPGRIAALVDMANDPATEAAIAASNVRVTGIVADLEVPGFGTLFGLLPGG